MKNALKKLLSKFFTLVSLNNVKHGNYVILNQAGACVDPIRLLNYADEKTLYGWQISDPILDNNPKMICEYNPSSVKPPQSYCFINISKGADYDK